MEVFIKYSPVFDMIEGAFILPTFFTAPKMQIKYH